MTRLYIVEQNSLDPGGHYFGYTCCVAEGARQAGLDPVILGNERFKDSAAKQKFQIVPTFTRTWTEAEQERTLEWGLGNIAYEMSEAFRRLSPAPDDHVLLHTLGYHELRLLLAWLTSKLPGDPIPYFHILLRRDPDLLVGNYRDYADYFTMLAASPYLQRKIRLHADTALLSAVFGRMCGVPFATAPIPFDHDLLRRALAARPRRRDGEPLTVAYLGDAREEKGYQHLPQALAYLWPDYIAAGRVRFVLQSNFNTPGGEPGILRAAQNLAGFPSTVFQGEALEPEAYYRLLAAADIVLLPYSPERYRYRSSGVLVEAIAAGKVIVTSAGSWLATQVTEQHAVLFDAPDRLGPAIAEAIDRFDALSAGAAARRGKTLARTTGAGLVKHLLAATRSSTTDKPQPRRRVLLIMDGDAMVLRSGASRIAEIQLRYLTAAGCEVVGLFLTAKGPDDPAAFSGWRADLARSIAPFRFERVFVAGPSGCDLDPEQTSLARDGQQRDASPLKAAFDFTAGFQYSGRLLRFLRAHPVDAILLNYITNYPVIDALGLNGVPVICEMHTLQTVERAILGHRLIDQDELAEEFAWLARCAVLVALNPREAVFARERLRDARIETTGICLPPAPPLLPQLAGAKHLAEIVSSSGPALPEYRGDTTRNIPPSDARQRLIEAGSLDLLYVGAQHRAHASGLQWFLSEVYRPYLEDHRVTMIIAGTIGREGWPHYPGVFFIDRVEDLGPLYAAARVVVLPILEGAGSPVKTCEALIYGRPVVGTAHAFRGIDGEPDEFIIRDKPSDFADAVLRLLNSQEARLDAARRSRRSAARYCDPAAYFRAMNGVIAAVLGSEDLATVPPEACICDETHVEWSRPIQAANRLVRAYLDGDLLEAWALDLLASEAAEADRLLDSIGRSLLDRRDAAVLRTELQLKAYAADPLETRLRQDAMFAIGLALDERRGRLPGIAKPDSPIRIVAHRGLAVTVAAAAKGTAALHVDGRALSLGEVREGGRCNRRTQLFQAEIAAVEGGGSGLRTLELDAAASGAPIALLRHSVPIVPGLRLLGQEVFSAGFRLRADGSGADLPPGGTGQLTLPRIVDGRNPGLIDLCFAGLGGGGAPATLHTGSALSATLADLPTEIETIDADSWTIARIALPAQANFRDFGLVPLTITNNGQSVLSLVAAQSGLLLQPVVEAAGIATAVALAGRPLEPPDDRRLIAAAREAIGLVVRSRPLTAAALDALCALSAGEAARSALRDLVEQEAARDWPSGSRISSREVDVAVTNVAVIVGACLGTGDPAIAVFSPVLPFEIVDESGDIKGARTETARREREGSWRVAMPPDATREAIRIRLDATLEIAGHPGVIGFRNFYPTEGDELFRWTGPELTSTIALPVALTQGGRLVIELGPAGSNTAQEDFTVACNGRAVPHRRETERGAITLTADLPPALMAGPATEIALTIRECHTPAPPDRRTLGVVFKTLALYLGDHSSAGRTEGSIARPAGRRALQPSRTAAGGNPDDRSASVGALHALVIDDSIPEPDKDAGSNAVLQHILSLQRIGYRVGFVPADNMARIEPYTVALERRGVECFCRPDYASVEEVLAGTASAYDLVYLHRRSNASRFSRAVRGRWPDARILYCVADLHFLRLQRQAEVEGDPALRNVAAEMRASELDAMSVADCVIVHSAAEATLLKQFVPGIAVAIVPWTIEPCVAPKSPPKRPQLAFIGGYRHPPNIDAARWATERLMPLLRQQVPGVELLLVGSHMPPEVAALAAADVLAVGHIASLDELFARIRLTIAPLRYGAGLKGKVLDSLAAGIPCVMTTIAAEGLSLPPTLLSLVADEPEETARRIATLCRDDRAYRRIAKAGQTYVAANYSATRIDTLLREACGLAALLPGVERQPGDTVAHGKRAPARA